MWLTNLKIGILGLAVIAFYTAVAHVIPQLESEVPQDLALGSDVTVDELIAAGEGVFTGAGICTTCHGLGTRAPNLRTDHAGLGTIGARCVAAFGSDCRTYLYTSLTSPGDSIVPGFENIMPNMGQQLPQDQVWAVIAYLQSLGGEVTVTAADLSQESADLAAAPAAAAPVAARTETMDPRELLTEKTCTVCHVIDGAGPPIGPPFDGIGSRLTADKIRQSILDPNGEVTEGYEQFAGTMPATFGQQLSAAQLEAIVQFLAARK
jgi:mono/diheme cytochrome c family protein